MKKSPYKLTIATLDGDWHDKDEVLLHACFQILVDFIEKESPDEIVDWEGSGPDHLLARQEMDRLYRWWKDIRPNRFDLLQETDIPDEYMTVEKTENGYCALQFHDDKFPHVKLMLGECTWQETEWLKEDTRNLQSLIDIRRYMWV